MTNIVELQLDQLDQLWYIWSDFGDTIMIVNISEAKTNLSKLIDRAFMGEEVIIAKNNLPLVDLVPHKPKGKRKLGTLAGKFTLPDDFLEEDPDINAMFYGDDG